MSALAGLVDLLEPWLCAHRDEAGLGRYWSPLAKETGQCLQLGKGGRERPSWGEGGDTSLVSLPSNQLPKGAAGSQISKSFAGAFSFSAQPKQPTLLSGAEGRFEVLGLGQEPFLAFSHDFYGCGLADLTFRQVPSAGALLDAMHGVVLHSPGTAGVAGRRWGRASRVPWDGETRA